MKYVLISAVAALGFASVATAESSYAPDTLMTRNVPAASVLAPRDYGMAKDGFVRVTVGQKLVEEADVALHPNELGQASDGTVNSYVFVGDVNANEGSYSYR